MCTMCRLYAMEQRFKGQEVNLKSVDSIQSTNGSVLLRVVKILFRSRFLLAKWVDLMSTIFWSDRKTNRDRYGITLCYVFKCYCFTLKTTFIHSLNALKCKYYRPHKEKEDRCGMQRFFNDFKVVLHNIDITAMCSLTKCKQSCFLEH